MLKRPVISEEIHRKVKTFAAEHDISIPAAYEKLLKKALADSER